MGDFVLFSIFLGSFVIMLVLTIRFVVKRRYLNQQRAALANAPYIVTANNNNNNNCEQQRQRVIASAYQMQSSYSPYRNANYIYPSSQQSIAQTTNSVQGFPIMTTQGRYLTFPINTMAGVDQQRQQQMIHQDNLILPSYEQVITSEQYRKELAAANNSNTSTV